MIIQTIALLDLFDKDVNLFLMRNQEWYGYHFSEFVRLESLQRRESPNGWVAAPTTTMMAEWSNPWTMTGVEARLRGCQGDDELSYTKPDWTQLRCVDPPEDG